LLTPTRPKDGRPCFGGLWGWYGADVTSRLLAIYLNDHFAGSVAGVALARRCLSNNERSELGTFLRGLVVEITDDQATLSQLMDELSIPRSRPKIAAAWTAERIGRLKLNGRVTGYSPLSRLVELEGLSVGIEGKRLLWVVLAQVGATDQRLPERDFAALAERARTQREGLEPYRQAAAVEALNAS
jgi:hypothetical protein